MTYTNIIHCYSKQLINPLRYDIFIVQVRKNKQERKPEKKINQSSSIWILSMTETNISADGLPLKGYTWMT